MYGRFFKRLLDVVLSLIGIVAFALPMLIIAMVIKAEGTGPVLFKTERVGKDKKLFRFYKFRSMRTDAPRDCAPRLLRGNYTTKVGAFLRKTSLDELPNHFCILKGDMSLVGPRPAGRSETDLIAERDKYGANGVLPGLTGLAQISGRDLLAGDPARKAFVDGEYVKKITFSGDMKILFKTVGKVLRREGIAEGASVVHGEREEVRG